MKLKLCITANILIVLMVAYGIFLMMSLTADKIGENGAAGGGALLTAGLRNMRFFTMLSNVLAGITAVVFLAVYLAGRTGGTPETGASGAGGFAVPVWLAVLKYAAAVSVTLTLVVVLVFLGPRIGYAYLFTGPNLWFHLIVPVAAIIEFIWLDSFEGFPKMGFPAALIAVVPMLLYGVWYFLNVLRGGMADGRYVNDWYGFASWGIPASFIVFAVVAVLTWLLALLLKWGNLRLR